MSFGDWLGTKMTTEHVDQTVANPIPCFRPFLTLARSDIGSYLHIVDVQQAEYHLVCSHSLAGRGFHVAS